MPGAKIGGQIAITDAKLEGGVSLGDSANALSIDRIEVAGSFYGERLMATGAVRLLGAKIGAQVSLKGARLEGSRDSAGRTSAALNADGVEVARGFACDEGFTAIGEVRMLGAKIGGQLSLADAVLEARKDGEGATDAFSIDRAEIKGSMFCERLSVKGQLRMPEVTIGGSISMRDAHLEHAESDDTTLNGPGIDVATGVYLDRLSSNGNVHMPGARVRGQLSTSGVEMEGARDEGSSFVLIGAKIDELILAFKKIQGTVDLRNAAIQSLWDADQGRLAGQLPERMRLEGCSYRLLREPLDARQRLAWIERSQGDHHYPGVYAELAGAFRRMGHRGDARKIGVANERRAREDLPRWSLRRPWHDFLWLTVGYGYRNWLAMIWLLGLIAVGSFAFMLNEAAFAPASLLAPPLEPVIYAIDTTVPILDLGQTRWWSATGTLAWLELFLAAMGYALVAAVIAAAAGIFNRDQI